MVNPILGWLPRNAMRIACALLSVVGVANVARAQVGTSATTPYFMIVNKYSGKALDLLNGDTSNGALINQWSFDANGPNQRWAILPTENNAHFKLISWVSGKCACIDQDSTANGAQLHAWDYVGNNPGQQFDFVDAGNGWFKIRNVKSGRILDDAAWGTANGNKIQQRDDGNTDNQLWRLQPWGDFMIRAASGRYICVANRGSSNGERIIQYDREDNPWFKWRFASEGDGWYGCFSLNAPSKVICVAGPSTTPGQYCHLWEYNNGNIGDQKLRIVPQNDGTFKFYFAFDGQTWDMPGGQTANAVPLEQYPNNGNYWQKFSLERVASGSTGGGTGGNSCNATTWAAGRNYNVGDVVLYSANGNYYKCTNANPGYDPTISTWFWSPTTCSGGTTGGGGTGGGGTTGGGTAGLAGVVTESQFNAWFPNRNGFYSYAGLISINQKYPDFCNSGDTNGRKREAAAFLANMALETGNLVYVTEINTAYHCSYCDGGQWFGCPAGNCSYYGRGPIQLSWNYNYKAAGDALGYDLLNNPNLVETNSSISWQTAGWFWMTQVGGGPATCHNSMVQGLGFGSTICTINGGLECPNKGGTNTASRDTRINNYKYFCSQLGVDPGSLNGCY